MSVLQSNLKVILFSLVIFILPAYSFANLSEGDAEIYKAAFRAVDAKKYKDARRIASEAKDPLLFKTIDWLNLREPNSGRTYWELTNFIENNPEWPSLSLLRKRVEEVMPASLDDEEVLRWFKKYSPMTLDGKMRYGDALARAGEKERLQKVVKEAWLNDFFTSKRERAFLRKFKKYLDKADHLARFERLLWDRHTRSAQRMYKFVSKDYQKLGKARIALYRRAGNVDALIAAVPKHLKEDPGLQFERLKWRRRHRLHDGAVEILLNSPQNPVRSDLWWRERDYQVRRALDDGKSVLAYDLAAKHRQIPGTWEYAEAEFLAGWTALSFLNEPGKALPHFKSLFDAVQYPISSSRGAYWVGRTYAHLGENRESRRWFKKASKHATTFYGQLAYVELNKDAKLDLPDQPPIRSSETNRFRNNELVKAINQLATIGKEKYIDQLVYRLADKESSPAMKELTAMLARRVGRFDLGVAISRNALKQNAPLVLEGYPIVEITREDGAEKSLVNAIIRQESNFKPKAKSRAGARGLMQVLPSTARKVSRGLRIRYSKAKLLNDPSYNITIGHAYLDKLLKRYDGSYVLALAAYNAGPARVNRWMKEFGDPRGKVDVVNWIEKIPFRETRNYVQRVLENLAVYRTRTQDFPFDEKVLNSIRVNVKDRKSAFAWNSHIHDVAWTHSPSKTN